MIDKPLGDKSSHVRHASRLRNTVPQRNVAKKHALLRALGAATLSTSLIVSMIGVAAPATAQTANPSASGSAATGAPSDVPESSMDSTATAEESKEVTELPSPTAVTPTSEPSIAVSVPAAARWEVVDEQGAPVSGATFSLERFAGDKWDDKQGIKDCVSGRCEGLDSDSESGKYQLDGSGISADMVDSVINADGRYRITPLKAPYGYVWDDAEAIDSKSLAWSERDNVQTLEVGTFTVQRAAAASLICEAGNVYGLSAEGQIQRVSPGGNVEPLGRPASSVSSFNGLGISAGGTSAFAYERTNNAQTATVYRYDVAAGTWQSTGKSINSTTSSRTVQFVAGAVNLDTGKYLIGGYASGGSVRVFRLWEYDPTTNSISYKGYIPTNLGRNDAANGDMAFDANGNLFVVQGNGTRTTVYSITAQNLANPSSTGLIQSSESNSFTTISNVNGVAFDADGRAYLGSASEMYRYDMPDWTNPLRVTRDLSSTDLASCGSPPTITLEKYVEGGRVEASDQFELSLRQGGSSGTELGSTTTSGNSTGLQEQRVGPLPTVRNVALTFSEEASGTTKLGSYASSYRCLVDGVQTVQGTGTSGTITIPANGQAVECRFYNSPLSAQVDVHKQITDSKGKNPQLGTGWTVGATAKPVAGRISSSPAASTQVTNAQGTASWGFAFGSSKDKATLAVNELMQKGYAFSSGVCEVLSLDGTTKKITLTGARDNPEVAFAPGDKVDCTFVNSLKPAKVAVGKELANIRGEDPKPVAGWEVGAVLGPNSGSGVSISKPETSLTTETGSVPNPWVIDFPTKPGIEASAVVKEVMQNGYEFIAATCVVTDDDGKTREQVINAESGELTDLAPGDFADCIFTNKPKPGSVTWQKIDTTTTPLYGSEWELTGPGKNGPTRTIADCVAADASECLEEDKDPRAGGFELADLEWGEYNLVETKAPAGFILDETEHEFTVGATAPAQLVWDLGRIKNQPREGLDLPLTGGTGTQTFLIGGGAALLAALGAVAWRRKLANSGE